MFPNWPGESRTSVRNTNFSQTHTTLLQNTQISVMGPWVFAGVRNSRLFKQKKNLTPKKKNSHFLL